RRLLVERPDDVLFRLNPVGQDLPLLAVPLLDLRAAATLVVGAAHPHRLQQIGEAKRVDTLRREVQVLDAPAHLLTGERLLAVLLLRGAHGFGYEHGIHDAAIVADAAEIVAVTAALSGLADMLHDLPVDRVVLAGAVEVQRLVPLGGVAGRNHRIVLAGVPDAEDALARETN